MSRWWVISPEYETYGGCYEPPEPPEYGRDAIEVEAETKRDALILGVAAMLKDSKAFGYCRENRESDLPPWAGVRVEPSPPCECCGLYEDCACRWAGEDPPYTCEAHGGRR